MWSQGSYVVPFSKDKRHLPCTWCKPPSRVETAPSWQRLGSAALDMPVKGGVKILRSYSNVRTSLGLPVKGGVNIIRSYGTRILECLLENCIAWSVWGYKCVWTIPLLLWMCVQGIRRCWFKKSLYHCVVARRAVASRKSGAYYRPPHQFRPPECTIFPCSRGEKERKKPYYQLVASTGILSVCFQLFLVFKFKSDLILI